MPVTNYPDGVNIGSSAGATADFQLGGTAVNVTAAELNALAVAGGLSGAELDMLDGAIGTKVLGVDSTTAYVAAFGSTAITGAGTVATGLGGVVTQVVASLGNAGSISAADVPAYVRAYPKGTTGGSVTFEVYDRGGTACTAAAGTVYWLAFGTAAS